MAHTKKVRLRRIYDDRTHEDGTRVLVDRLWPRGMSKEQAHLDEWLKDVAPSTELRKWYGHDPDRFEKFETKYKRELEDDTRANAYRLLKGFAKKGTLTLLTASKAVEISEAAVLCDMLNE